MMVESYADRLMDELFEDIEHVLQSGSTLPEEPARPDPATLNPIQIPPLMLVPDALQRREDPDSLRAELENSPAPLPSPRRSWDRLLLGAGFVALVVPLGIWLFVEHQQQASRPTPTATVQKSPEPPHMAFANYLQRSLEAIGRKQGGQSPVLISPSPLPTVAVNANPSPSASPSSKASPAPKRIYIPVPPTTTIVRNTPTATIAPVSPTARPETPATPAVTYSLVGVLELGDRSAALFEINGVTQRFQLGESIGTSGWRLVEISKQQAIIRRNGEVRSVFVGQKL